jgi:hypothetical protein
MGLPNNETRDALNLHWQASQLRAKAHKLECEAQALLTKALEIEKDLREFRDAQRSIA